MKSLYLSGLLLLAFTLNIYYDNYMLVWFYSIDFNTYGWFAFGLCWEYGIRKYFFSVDCSCGIKQQAVIGENRTVRIFLGN